MSTFVFDVKLFFCMGIFFEQVARKTMIQIMFRLFAYADDF